MTWLETIIFWLVAVWEIAIMEYMHLCSYQGVQEKQQFIFQQVLFIGHMKLTKVAIGFFLQSLLICQEKNVNNPQSEIGGISA